METSIPPKIGAIIATYNRKDVAAECVRRVMHQTRPVDKVCVVVNGSTDGTADEIARQFGQYPHLDLVTLADNTGAAGGVYHGMKRCYEDGCDWVWILDDDAWPRPDALEKLELLGLSPKSVYASLVIDNKTGDLAFPYAVMNGRSMVSVQHVHSLPDGCSFELRGAYLGSLISREAILSAGFVLPGMFIRGEDEEYPARLKAHGYRFLCTKDSVVEHPGQTLKKFSLLGKHFAYEPHLPPWKAYYVVRNHAYVKFRYSRNRARGTAKALGWFALSLSCALLLDDQKLTRLRYYAIATAHGLAGKLERWGGPRPSSMDPKDGDPWPPRHPIRN